MALMFQQKALNFAKNGFYPTDSETTARILSALTPCTNSEMRILDPCAGEGVALAECKQHLGVNITQAFGIEYNEKRAWHAKAKLDRCIYADLQNCVISRRSFGLLFLNPPYGDLVADKAETGFVQNHRPRLEKLFYQLSVSALQLNGILVLIIPVYSLDKELSHWIAHNFDDVEVFAAPEQRFKQIVLFGKRTSSDNLHNPRLHNAGTSIKSVKDKLIQIGLGEIPAPELPSVWNFDTYKIPAAPQTEVKFFTSRLDARQLAVEIDNNPGLWDQFHQRFGSNIMPPRRPLMSLSEWHLALSLAAGQVSGIVTSTDGRIYIIKGDTYKDIQISKTYEENDDGDCIETTVHLDKFVPVLKALDMTPQSLTFGEVLTIAPGGINYVSIV